MSDLRELSQDILGIISSGLVFTDLMIEEGEPIMAKTPAGWCPVEGVLPADGADIESVLSRLEPGWKDTIKTRSINRPMTLSSCRLRINAYLGSAGEKRMLSIRKIDLKVPTIESTGLPGTVRLLLDSSKGLILVGGSTGSGKSTTLAALVEEINNGTKGAHIVTIEDPIEYKFARKQAIFSQREIGVDVASFFDGVRDAMRQRPDIIVIGEIRDRDTAETAILAAESGVLVIGTLHANNAAGCIKKLLSFFNANEREARLHSIENTLVGVVSQQLLPAADGKGWVLAAEMLFNHKQQCTKILDEPEKIQSLLERSEDKVCCTMDEALFQLVKSKRLAKADAYKAISGLSKDAFVERLRQLP